MEPVNISIAYDNITALLKSVLKTVMNPPGGLKRLNRHVNACNPTHTGQNIAGGQFSSLMQ